MFYLIGRFLKWNHWATKPSNLLVCDAVFYASVAYCYFKWKTKPKGLAIEQEPEEEIVKWQEEEIVNWQEDVIVSRKEDEIEEPRSVPVGRLKQLQKSLLYGTRYSDQDTLAYRNGYPEKIDFPGLIVNREFYFNRLRSVPDGDYIEHILTDWRGDYKLLERHHGYIQWLFPIREKGMNYQSQELQVHEIKAIMGDKAARERVVRSYKLMLDFYGLRLADEKTGQIERAENWEERFRHLNSSYHNYLRITRILKCLGEFGLEHYKRPFLKLMLHEAIANETLPNCARSCVEFWVGTVKNDEEREELKQLAERLIAEKISHKTQKTLP